MERACGLFLFLLCIVIIHVRFPAGEGQALHRAEDLGFHVRIVRRHAAEQFLDLVALGGLVHRTGVFDHRDLQRLGETRDLLLPRVDKGADLRDAGAVEIGDRAEAAEPPLEEQREHKGLDRVVKVVAERELVDPARADRVVERAAAHLGAQRAGVFLLAHVKDDLLDVGLETGIGHAELFTQRRHGGKVHPLKAELDRDRLERKRLGIKAAQVVERQEQQHAVLAARNADGDGVARFDHMIVVHRAAHGAGKLV